MGVCGGQTPAIKFERNEKNAKGRCTKSGRESSQRKTGETIIFQNSGEAKDGKRVHGLYFHAVGLWGILSARRIKKHKNHPDSYFFQTISFGKARIYYVRNDAGELMHTSYVVPRCFKFPFLGRGDYEIGPCYTYPLHRGKGLYPATLRFICENLGGEGTTFYIIVRNENTPSIRGIEKAGFEYCGDIRESGIFKRYLRKQ
ncbi:MAG TPA: hypothetical protein H9694_03680 [Firmicutes bacterium]|nr:hypothetical protein [Bacillota bacterium]